MKLFVEVDNLILARKRQENLADHNSLELVFEFIRGWSEHTAKTCRVVWNKGDNFTDYVLDENLSCTHYIEDTTDIYIGVYDETTTSTPLIVSVYSSILNGSPHHEEPSPDIYNQILEKFTIVNTKVDNIIVDNEGLHDSINRIDGNIENIEDLVSDLSSDVEEVQSTVTTINTKVTTLQTAVGSHTQAIASINTDLMNIDNTIDIHGIAIEQLVQNEGDIINDITTLTNNKQNKLTAGANITIVNDVISASGGSGGSVDDVKVDNVSVVTSGVANISLSPLSDRIDNAESNITTLSQNYNTLADIVDEKQDKLTAGSGITIQNNVISATGGSGATVVEYGITPLDDFYDLILANSPIICEYIEGYAHYTLQCIGYSDITYKAYFIGWMKNGTQYQMLLAGCDWNGWSMDFPKFDTDETLQSIYQRKLTAGTGITIQNNVISATGGGGSWINMERVTLSANQHNTVTTMLPTGVKKVRIVANLTRSSTTTGDFMIRTGNTPSSTTNGVITKFSVGSNKGLCLVVDFEVTEYTWHEDSQTYGTTYLNGYGTASLGASVARFNQSYTPIAIGAEQSLSRNIYFSGSSTNVQFSGTVDVMYQI